MLTIAAMAMLAVLTMSYYAAVGNSGKSLSMTTAGLTATTVATSYIERATNTAFDEKSDTSSLPLKNPDYLTHWDSLGRDQANEVAIDSLDDFDDFNGWVENYSPTWIQGNDTLNWMNESYRVGFKVYYVDTTDFMTPVPKRTFIKRMDLTVWRTWPPNDPTLGGIDTVKMSTIYGYFKY